MRDNNDLGHPICDNLRAGDWMASYTMNRLRLHAGTKKLGDLLATVFARLAKLPRYLNPCYFEAIISTMHQLLTQSAIAKMGKYVGWVGHCKERGHRFKGHRSGLSCFSCRFVRNGSSFIQRLALGSVQLYGECRSTRLPPPTPDSEPTASLAAGLPHFATGFMRCWGRDTFIALRGMLMVTERFQDA